MALPPVTRSPVLSASSLEQIEAAMLRLLAEVGVRVPDDDLRRQFAARGFCSAGDRTYLEPATVQAFLAEERARNGHRSGPIAPEPASSDMTVYVSPYPQHVHDFTTDRLVPFTTERLIEATKLLDVLHDRGVVSSPPGCPSDVPPPLQPVLQYWIAASFSRQGRAPVDPKSEETFPHVAEMAQVLGHPLRHLPVYVFSPLNLGGESLRCAVKYRDRLDAVGVCSMPSPGCTTPVRLGDALAVASAEVIGPVILLRELLGLPVHWHVSVFPIDLRHMAMVFGSPESLLFEWAGRELTAHYQGTQWLPWADNMHTNAKLPGAQASAERSSLMVQGALLGARHFGAAGTLSLDEAFSAEQLLYDLEVKDHCERLVQGLDPACDPERCLAEVQAGLEAGGFAALDATLDGYRDLYWHPRLFDRDFVGAWQARGAPTARARAQEMVAQLTAGHDFELDSGLQDALDAILESAGAHFGARLRAPQPLD